MRVIRRVDRRVVRLVPLFLTAIALVAYVPLMVACTSGPPAKRAVPDAPAKTVTHLPATTPTAVAAEVTPADPTEAPKSTFAPAARCPDPNLTPVPSPEAPDATPGADATPAPIRIAHPASVPALSAPGEDATSSPAAPPFIADAALDAMIRARLGADASHYAVVIEDLRDGRGVAIDQDRVFYAASLFKLEVMYEVYDERAAGLLGFDEQFVASDYYSSFDLGPHLVAPCARESVRDLLHAMMSVSDNVAAVMLQDRAGAGNINDGMAALGLTQTRLTADGTLPATAADMARLVGAIAQGDAVNAAASSEMSDLMATETINDRIPARLPAGIRVAHKTGNWDDATHDAGIVYGTQGTYVMVLMSDLGFGSDAASVEADVARIAFDHFEQ